MDNTVVAVGSGRQPRSRFLNFHKKAKTKEMTDLFDSYGIRRDQLPAMILSSLFPFVGNHVCILNFTLLQRKTTKMLPVM